MRLVVHGHNVDVTGEIHDRIERMATDALGSLGRQVGRVTVRLHRLPEGDETLTICHVFVELHPWGGFGLGEFGPTVERAVHGALARAGLEARHQLGSARPAPRVTSPPDFSVLPIPFRAMARA